MSRSLKTLFLVVIWICVLGFTLPFLTGGAPANAAPGEVPPDAEPFQCWYYNVPADGNWYPIDEYTNPSCAMTGTAVDIFPVAANTYVFVTDVQITPTAPGASGAFYYSLRRGYEFNNDLLSLNSGPDFRTASAESILYSSNAPIMIIEPDRYLLIQNDSPDTTGSEWADFTVQGYVVTDTTVNPTALSNISPAISPPVGAPWLLLLLMIGLAFFTYHQIRREPSS